jgi:hypothetical protein
MTDYLNNLAARSLQLSPVVRPRLPSLYEPSSMAAGHASAVHEDETSTVSASDGPRTLPLARPRAKFEMGSGTNAIETENNNNAGPAGTATLQANGVTLSAPRIVTHLGSQRIRADASSIPSLTAKAAQTPRSKGDSEPRDLIETIAMRALAFGVAGSAMRGDRAKPPAPNEATSAAPETAPTISVTIGRVEVRAVYPQPPAQPARRAHPAPMSLDEYFKKRSEGRK